MGSAPSKRNKDQRQLQNSNSQVINQQQQEIQQKQHQSTEDQSSETVNFEWSQTAPSKISAKQNKTYNRIALKQHSLSPQPSQGLKVNYTTTSIISQPQKNSTTLLPFNHQPIDDPTIFQLTNSCIESGSLAGIIHLIENQQVIFNERFIKTPQHDNIIHLVCRKDRNIILEYILIKVYESQKEQFSEIIADQVNNIGEDVVDICAMNNSHRCLVLLLKTGIISLENNYARYWQRAVVSNAFQAKKLLETLTQSGRHFPKRRINQEFLNQLADQFSKQTYKSNQLTENNRLATASTTTQSMDYFDPNFLHLPKSVYGKYAGQHYIDHKQILWLTPEQILNFTVDKTKGLLGKPRKPTLFGDTITSSDMWQGESKTCYFLAVLGCLSEYHIRNLFESIDIKQKRYWCGFYICGQKQIIDIDEYLPCSVITGQPLFAKLGRNGSYWVALVEKSWAKLQGSYIDTDNFQTEEAMEALTPFPNEGYWLKDMEIEELFGVIEGAAGLRDNNKQKYQIIDRNKDMKKDKINEELQQYKLILIATSQMSSQQSVDRQQQLVPNHAYSVLAVFKVVQTNQLILKLRNPWGSNQWKGCLQETRINQLAKDYDSDFFEEPKDGLFYMTLNEFAQNFSYMCLTRSYPGYQYAAMSVPLKHRKAKYFKIDLSSADNIIPTRICFRLHQLPDSQGNFAKMEFRLFRISKPFGQLYYNGVDCWESQRVTYLSRKQSFIPLSQGEYALKVKIYKSHSHDQGDIVTVSSYSSRQIKLEPMTKEQGKKINNEFINKLLFNQSPSICTLKDSQACVKAEWDKYYRFLISIENKSTTKTVNYHGNIRMKENLVMCTNDVKVINKQKIELAVPPGQMKVIKFKIKTTIKKAKIDIVHELI